MVNRKIDQTYEELKPNHTLLGREQFYSNFHDEILSVEGTLHIALCGSWGTGKTVFVRKLHDQLLSENVLTVYVNAWQNDYYETPIYAFLSTLLKIEEFNKAFIAEVDRTKIENPSVSIGVPFLNLGLKISSLKSEVLSTIKYSSIAQEIIESVIREFMAEKGNRIVFIIDELDRCRPDFSIKLLEQLKHLAFDKNVVFTYVMDEMQLSLSMKAVYGQNYDTLNYLHKIFDLMIMFPKLSEEHLTNYISSKQLGLGAEYWVKRAIISTQNLLDLSLRDVNRLMPFIERIESSMRYGGHFGPTNTNVLCLILTIIALLKIKDPMLIREILNNQQSMENIEVFFSKIEGLSRILGELKSKNPQYSEDIRVILDFLFGRNSGVKTNFVKIALFDIN